MTSYLLQPSFPPGQPPSVVFATPTPPQMNPTPQSRQFAPAPRPIHQQGSFRSLQPYYTNRASLPPSSGPRGVPPSSAPRPVTPTHVYQTGPGSQMMMIPGQQLPFPSSPQGPTYFISGQYRSAPYVATPQQYPVTAGTPGFYPGTSPAEYGTYAGAYYPAQAQFTPSVQAPPVIMNPAPQQQQPPPQPPQHIPTKRERKQIIIRDPNQGGRDITEEIMSGGRSGSTPTPPQTAISGSKSTSLAQANGESVTAAATPVLVRPDDRGKPTPLPLSKSPELAKGDPSPTESTSSDTNTKPPLSEAEDTPHNTIFSVAPSVPVADVMDAPSPPREPTPLPQLAPEVPAYPAPFPDPVPTSAAQDSIEKKAAEAKEELQTVMEIKAEEADASLDTPVASTSTSNGVTEVDLESLSVILPAGQLEDLLESPIAQPEELLNGLPLPAPQDPEAPAASTAECDDSPIAEPDESQSVIQTSTAITQAAPAPVVQATPAPVDQPAPASSVEETGAELVIETGTTQPEVQDMIPPVTLDVKEDTLVPQSTAKEEMPSPAETVSIADSTTELLPTPPTPAADKREDTPSPQTVALALVETTMQAAVSVPKKKRKMKDLNKKEAGDLLDAFKEVCAVVNLFTCFSCFNEFTVQLGIVWVFSDTSAKRIPYFLHHKVHRIIRRSLNYGVYFSREDSDVEADEDISKLEDNISENLELESDFDDDVLAKDFYPSTELKVRTTDKPDVTVNFRKLLLNRCQKEFEKDKDDDEIFEKKQKELEAASGEEEKQRLIEELADAKEKARRRSLGNIKFIGELFKLKMLTEVIMHDCIVKLLKNHDEESLECLCRLLSTIGKDLDFEKAKPRMDQYFNQMEKIIKERKTSSRIRFMLQDVLDLRRNNWVPRRGDQGPKTIDQIHKEAELEEHREHMKVQQALISKKDSVGGPGGRMGGVGPGGRGGPHTPGRGAPPQDEGWNTVPISKNRPIDTSRLSKITKTPVLDFNNQLLAPGGKGTWGSWGKGSSGGTSAKPVDSGSELGSRPTTSTLNRFSALQQPSSSSGSSLDSDRRVPQRNSSSRERGDRFDHSDRGSDRFDRRDDRDRNRLQVTKRSFSRENEERSREREQRGSADPVRRISSMTDDRDRGSRERARSKENVKHEKAATPPPPQTPTKPALTEEELDKKSTAIIEEYLHINDMKEALQCVQEMNSTQLLFVFVRNGLESTLERSTIAREHMGLLLHQLVKTGILLTQQYYKGLQEILEVAEDMAIDIPHMWLYLAELITPMLHEGGVSMGELFREISKPLIPLGKAGVLLVHILTLLCKEMSHKKAGTMWRDAGLQWKDFLPEDVDVNKFVTEKNVEFTLGDESEKSKTKELSSSELSKQLDRLIQDKADNQRIFDWIEANLDEQQTSSNMFVRVLMTSICQSAIICENPYKVDGEQIKQRAKLLQKYLKDEQKELQALYALQALMVQMEQPANLLRMFFDTLYDEDVIKEEAFYKWESSKDPAEQQGKGVALKSVTAFFTWLREAEDESDNS
uniref:eukaryotic translation initiation factor 4 gamma 1 n=1 Tax=Monopterus albus TaxID=43700 RepID=UPI0009B4C217|nr:eukaryotic translation initiation factor 4 gamma 1 [Monopterus albus]